MNHRDLLLRRAGRLGRRAFLRATCLATGGLASALSRTAAAAPTEGARKPNLVFILADQWRVQATDYNGDPNLKGHTPNLDRLAKQSVNLTTAVSGCPVCSPYRGSLLTGQYPLRHGVFINDVPLADTPRSVAHVYARAGYATGYIGKWHINAGGRSNYIPPERRQGFEYWKVLECTHSYNHSPYYDGNDPQKKFWDGYDAIAQTADAERYIRDRATEGKPFILFLSWGPPHAPYETAPEEYRARFKPADVQLRPNVPEKMQLPARRSLAGYYAHIAALDDCIGSLRKTLAETGLEEDTVLVFTSDHGDMLYSQGETKKQRPWDESIRVPFLVRYPRGLGHEGRVVDMPFNAPDIMPTLLGLCNLAVPDTVEGHDYSAVLRGDAPASNDAALITCPSPFGQWPRGTGREYRGVRTRRHTFVRDLNGPWLLYDNEADPYQQTNLVNRPEHKALQDELDGILRRKLAETHDEFLPGETYLARWKYDVDKKTGTMRYAN